MFELRSDEKKLPIRVETYEEAYAIKSAVEIIFEREIFLTGEVPETFDKSLYDEYYFKLKGTDVDVIILGMDLAQLEQKEDYSTLLNPIFEANAVLVNQYKSGNEKALNALLGKFLKEHKGYEPREVKDEIIKLIG